MKEGEIMGILCSLCIMVLVILFLPIGYYLTVNNARGLYIDGRVTYGLGLVSCLYQGPDRQCKAVFRVLGIPVYGFCPHKEVEDGQHAKITGIVSGIRTKRKLFDYLPGIVRDIIKTIIGRETALRLKLGFEDPAYTGIVTGLIACMLTYFGGVLQYTPDFSGKNFEVDLYLKGVIIPIVLIFIGAKHGALYLKDLIFERNNVKGGRRYEFNG